MKKEETEGKNHRTPPPKQQTGIKRKKQFYRKKETPFYQKTKNKKHVGTPHISITTNKMAQSSRLNKKKN